MRFEKVIDFTKHSVQNNICFTKIVKKLMAPQNSEDIWRIQILVLKILATTRTSHNIKYHMREHTLRIMNFLTGNDNRLLPHCHAFLQFKQNCNMNIKAAWYRNNT
jgi:hypothetical protein